MAPVSAFFSGRCNVNVSTPSDISVFTCSVTTLSLRRRRGPASFQRYHRGSQSTAAPPRRKRGGCIIDLRAKGRRERIIKREARPRRNVNLLGLRIHGVFRQRLQMLPTAQRSQPSDVRAVVHGKVAAVAFAVDGAFSVGWPKFAAFGDSLTVRANLSVRTDLRWRAASKS
jgi:hypothetical protein